MLFWAPPSYLQSVKVFGVADRVFFSSRETITYPTTRGSEELPLKGDSSQGNKLQVGPLDMFVGSFVY